MEKDFNFNSRESSRVVKSLVEATNDGLFEDFDCSRPRQLSRANIRDSKEFCLWTMAEVDMLKVVVRNFFHKRTAKVMT